MVPLSLGCTQLTSPERCVVWANVRKQELTYRRLERAHDTISLPATAVACGAALLVVCTVTYMYIYNFFPFHDGS